MCCVSAAEPSQLTTRRLKAGAGLWVGTVQFLVVEAVVEAHWTTNYDRRDFYISDLGALHCADRGGRFVCSPWHAAMNASFIGQGFLIAGGALLLHRLWRQTSTRWQARSVTALLVAAGAGVALVGLAPEDAVPRLHVLGAAANFAAGNAGLVMLLFVGRGRRSGAAGAGAGDISATWAGALGAVGLAALTSFLAGRHWGLGVGGIERVIAYPIPVGLPVVAIGVLFGLRRARWLKVAAEKSESAGR